MSLTFATKYNGVHQHPVTEDTVGRRIRSSRHSETQSKAKQNKEEKPVKSKQRGGNATKKQNKTKQNHQTNRQLILMLRPLVGFQRPELQG